MVLSKEDTSASANTFKDPPHFPQDLDLAEAALAMEEDEPGSVVAPPLTHNPLHELESIWWLLLYVLAMSLVEVPSAGWDRSAQIYQLDEVFPIRNFAHKVATFTSYGRLEQLAKTVDSKIRDRCFRSLEVIKFTLLMTFTATESTFPEPVDTTQWDMKSGLYTVFKDSLRKLQRAHWPKMKPWNQ
jgi:hypothetical protein